MHRDGIVIPQSLGGYQVTPQVGDSGFNLNAAQTASLDTADGNTVQKMASYGTPPQIVLFVLKGASVEKATRNPTPDPANAEHYGPVTCLKGKGAIICVRFEGALAVVVESMEATTTADQVAILTEQAWAAQ